MANEINLTLSMSVLKSSVMNTPLGLTFQSLIYSMTGNYVTGGTVTVTTAAMALPLGSVANPGYMIARNMDATNFLRFMNGSGGAKVAKLKAGEACIFPWDETATPYVQADTAAIVLAYVLASR
jgi:hypothetical protein